MRDRPQIFLVASGVLIYASLKEFLLYASGLLPYFMLIEALSLLIPSLYESFRLGPIGLDFHFFFN